MALSSLQRWIAGEGMPAFDSVAMLATGKGVALDWIATGAGEMFLASQSNSEPVAPEDDKYVYVPLYDARCSAGSGSWNEGAKIWTQLAFTRYSLQRKGLIPESLSAIQVSGDSMVPLLDDSDTVLIDHKRNSLEGEGIYVIHLDDHLYAKRLQRQFDGSLSIISENKAYQTMAVPKERLDELQIIGRVVWAGGWMV
ncbi:S24 family peptidase [Pseudomonas sp. SJZ079]|uniref:LexA family transcriptional regulator n=1 Tax=Pseudomonas sp. SJZ079 TaxID=2572887 RepID=UPI0035325E6A